LWRRKKRKPFYSLLGMLKLEKKKLEQRKRPRGKREKSGKAALRFKGKCTLKGCPIQKMGGSLRALKKDRKRNRGGVIVFLKKTPHRKKREGQ